MTQVSSSQLNHTNLKMLKLIKRQQDNFSKVESQIKKQGKDSPIIVLDHIEDIEGLNLKLLLKSINKRISMLYNRSHIIPHGYFSTLVDKTEGEAKEELAFIFKNKVIPILQRYFNNDWEKIRQVLKDDVKIQEDEKYQIIKKLDNKYELNTNALDDIITYKKIYE